MKREAVVSFVLIVLFLISVFPLNIFCRRSDSHGLSGRVAQSTVDEWPMFHHDLTHTGYSTSTAPTTNRTLWNYPTGPVYSSPSVVGGVVYVGSDDGNVYALNATTGVQLWNYSNGFPIWSSPAVVDGFVYVGSSGGNVYALNATTGAVIWGCVTSWVYSSPAVADGLVYVGSCDDKVYGLNATTGAKIWSYLTGASVAETSPSVVGGVVYVGSDDGNVYALNAATGALIWNYTTGNCVWSAPAVVSGVVYVGSNDGNIYALNAATGNVVWYRTTNGVVLSSPAVVSGVVYVGSWDGKVYALNATTGVVMWNYKTSAGVLSSPAVVDGVVYVGSSGGHVYAFGVHDVAVTNVVSSKDGCLPMPTIGQGFNATIAVTVVNQGSFDETFNLTLYATISIAQQNVTLQVTSQNVALGSGNDANITFVLNTAGYPYGNYTISAYALPVPGETNTANNNLTGGTIYVTKPGDVNGDGRVNILDSILVSNAFLAMPGSPNWTPNADIDGSGQVNILDSIILSNHWTG